ncbi:hypothetical protein D3C81_1674540 [compost metagenome]
MLDAGLINAFQLCCEPAEGQQRLHAIFGNHFTHVLDAGRAQSIVVHTAFEERQALATEVVHRCAGMVMQVVSQVRGFFIETFLRHERLGLQMHTILLIKPDDAKAQPLIQHHTPADISADRGHQGIE